jgi:hypothetical protein
MLVLCMKSVPGFAWLTSKPLNHHAIPNCKLPIHLAHFTTRNLLRRTSAKNQGKYLINGATSLAATDKVPSGEQQSLSKVPKQLVKKKLQTFLRYLEVECWKRSDLRGLEPVLQGVASACKQINRIVQRAQTDDVYGVALDAAGNPLSDTNVQGEVQQKLDVLCNTIMLQAFCGSGREIHSVASEEEDEPRCCSDVMVRVHHRIRCLCFDSDQSLTCVFRLLERFGFCSG